MTSQHILLSISLVLVLGFLAQYTAWRLKIPSIILLLVFGFLGGQIGGFIKPDLMFGIVFQPLISICVAIILFEGSLSLRWEQIKESGARSVRNLVTIGTLVTLFGTSALAYFVLNLSLSMSVLLGSILVVTGPTVIGPILRTVRPKGMTGTLLKWEGIVIDPIGVMLAVLVFEVVQQQVHTIEVIAALLGVVITIIVGFLVGYGASQAVVMAFKRYALPDYLKNPFALVLVLTVHTVCEMVQHEAGLFGVNVMGIALANQKKVSISRILEFKENLQTVIISALFILLSARIRLDFSLLAGWQVPVFLLGLVLLRPMAVWLSTLKAELKKRELLYLGMMAPRGIVAAAMVSIFALELEKTNSAEANALVVYVFIVIIFTVTLYGLMSFPLAKKLKLADPDPQGVLIFGANALGRALALAIKQAGFRTILVDTNVNNVAKARKNRLNAISGNLFSEEVRDQVNLSGIGRLFALTENDQANSLAAVFYEREFGRAEIYQSFPEKDAEKLRSSHEFRGRYLFAPDLTVSMLNRRIGNKFEVETIEVNEFTMAEIENKMNQDKITPLLLVASGQLIPFTASKKPDIIISSSLIALVEYTFWERLKARFDKGKIPV